MKKTIVSVFFILLLFVLNGFGESFEAIPQEKIAVVPDFPNDLEVSIQIDRPVTKVYYPGEEVTITFWTNKDAFVVIYDIAPDGKVSIIFPNGYDQDNFVRANKKITLPREGYKFEVENKRGKEYLQIVACDHQFVTFQVWREQFTHTVFPPISSNAIDYFKEFMGKIIVVPDKPSAPKPIWASQIIYFFVR
ncbi:MAG TPA: DUF4384 domain-containing protein [Thermotogota bacterium]|nr:DUF4384 domain-containing protein [Thermotogota bacterium]HRW92987.1 DUF4384 domain-containing protein [Thermotogota bacterium]